MSFRKLLLSGCIVGFFYPALAETKPAAARNDSASAGAVQSPAPSRPSFPEIGTQLTQTGAPPVLKRLMDSNVQLVSLGEVSPGSGIVGYLAEAQDGKFQTFYLMPDGLTLVAGLAFRLVNGNPQPTLENVTARQVEAMRQRLEASRENAEESRRRAIETAEAARKRADEAAQSQRSRIEELDDRSQQANAALKQFERVAPIAAVPTMGTQPVVVPVIPQVPVVIQPPPITPPVTAPIAQPAPEAVKPQAAVPAPATGGGISKDDFLAALNNGKTQWFDLGPASAPMVVMVADPKCPYCHQAWTKLVPMINDKRLRMRVVLIPANPESEASTISLLSKQGANEPGRSFWLGQGSEEGKSIDPPPPVGSPQYAQGLEAARQNLAFVEKFHDSIKRTPFFAYVDGDGRLRTGGADDLEGFLQALPASPVAKK